MESTIYGKLRRFITVVDELRDVGLQQYVNLPRICVIGTQSAGKSSVLESIVGLDFLPRGDGVVTRRPLELRLVHLSENSSKGSDPRAVFDLGNGETATYTDFKEVRKCIEKLTDEVAGTNKGIVDDPIVLTVYGSHCPDLTLIDLPGITRVPLKGTDQTDDVERLTRDMALRYARDARTIILAVVPGNADISTADALQLGRRVDPKGSRTIGVVTKIDLMDRGTDAASMLLGEDVPLKLGYTGVKNRSQADIKEGRSVAQCMEDEKEFFQSHPIYRTLPAAVMGTKSLIEKLTNVLFRHIKSVLPDIKREINTRLRAVSSRLEDLGEGVPVEPNERVQLMWTMITDYCEIYKNTIRGKYDKRLQTYFEQFTNDSGGGLSPDFSGGAQIRIIFNELLDDFVEKDVTSEMTDYDIDVAIRMHEGDSLPGFPSPDTFEYLILPHLRKIHGPVLDCLEKVTQSLEVLSHRIAGKVFSRFPQLAEEVLELSQDILTREKEATKQVLENMVASETGYLFTNDSGYLSHHGAMIQMGEKQGGDAAVNENGRNQAPEGSQPSGSVGTSQGQPGQPKSSERATQLLGSMQQSVTNLWSSDKKDKNKTTRYSGPFIREIRRRLDAYFSIVLRNIRDMAPKAIGYFLVRQLQDKLQFELYNQLNQAEQISALLGEPAHIVAERKKLQHQLQTLKKSSLVLQRDADINAIKLGLDDDDMHPIHKPSAPSEGGRQPHSVFDDGPQSVKRPPMISPPVGQSPGHNLPGSSRPQEAALFGSGNAPPQPKGSESRKGALFDKQHPAGGGKPLFDMKESTKRAVPNNPLFG